MNTRGILGDYVAGLIRLRCVIKVLSKLISVRGVPRYLHIDNGPEFVSAALLKWVTEQGIECALIDPDKPWQMARKKASTADSVTNAWPWNDSGTAWKPRW